MHQQPLLAPPLPKRSSRAGHREGVSGRMMSFHFGFVAVQGRIWRSSAGFILDRLLILLPEGLARQTVPKALSQVAWTVPSSDG